MDREFERFRGGPNEAASKRVHVTISPAKLILLNRNIYYQMGRPAAVFLNYSRSRDVIALEPANPRIAESFPVMPNGTGWRVNAAPFCRHFGISIESTLKFVHPELIGTCLHLKLAETVAVGGWKKKKRSVK